MEHKKLISKADLIKKIGKKATISVAKATQAYECIFNESPAFRTQVPVEVIKEVTLVREVINIEEVMKLKDLNDKLASDLARLNNDFTASNKLLNGGSKSATGKKNNEAVWKKKEAKWKSEKSDLKTEIAKLKKELAKKPKTVEVIKEVEVVKSIDLNMLKKMVGKLGTKQVSKKVVGETRKVKEGKIVSRKEVRPESRKAKSAAKKTVSSKKDDLTRIEGIGPKIAEHLQKGRIKSFKQLADAKVSTLQEILDAAGPRYRMHVPNSWPKQSKLAAAGKWEALDKLQDKLDGGK